VGATTATRKNRAARDPNQLAKEGRELLQEVLKVVRETGVQTSVRRGIQASRAAAVTAVEVARELRKTTSPGDSLESLRSSVQSLDYPGILRRLFERLGATYIKLGQFIASSPTLFPEEYVREFQRCLDQAQSVPYDQIKRIIREELGSNPESIFAKIDPEPLASASVAQVHAATLKTGEEVVLKVLKPGVETVLKTDLGFIYITSRLLELLSPDLGRTSLADIVGDLRECMLDELDFRKEAENLREFREFLDGQGITGATAPAVYPKYSAKRVLCLERFRGVPIADLQGMRRYTNDPEGTLINALNTWALSVLLCKSFHADVHSGNLLVLEDGRVGFIDFGIVGRIPPKTWTAINDLAEAIVVQDYRLMAKAMVSMGATETGVDLDRFSRDLEELGRRIAQLDLDLAVAGQAGADGTVQSVSAQIQVDNDKVTELVLEVVRVAEDNGLKLPREFGLLLKQSLYFDRYRSILAPELDMLGDDRVKLVTI